MTFLSKQPVATGSNVAQQITKAYVKFQLTSVPGISQTAANVPVSFTFQIYYIYINIHYKQQSATSTADIKPEEISDPKKTVGARFINKLYSKSSNTLDVRWKGEEKNTESEEVWSTT